MSPFKKGSHFWLYPFTGALLGGFYVLLDEGILDTLSENSALFLILHEFVDAIFPILCGILAGIGIFLFRKQSRLNSRLSLRNDRLQKDLLLNTLISQILHEVRNPIHNIQACLEDYEEKLPPEKVELIRRNIEKINQLKKQYGKWDNLFDEIDPSQSLEIKNWLESFLDEKIAFQFKEYGVSFEKNIENVVIFMHPLLFEQALLTLFSNAFQAVQNNPSGKRNIVLSIKCSENNPDKIEILFTNNGTLFPKLVLENQAKKPTEGSAGLGLGLLLLRKIVEQCGGNLALSNTANHAVVAILLRGKKL